MYDLREYQSDVLFLLIGYNPLPNYVAARLLLKPGGTLFLIHSADTKDVARRLMLQLPSVQYSLVPVDITEPRQFYSDIGKFLNPIISSPVGFNYTGGTKFMAVYAYQAIVEHCKKHNLQGIFTYLDANSLQLRIASELGDAEPPIHVASCITDLDISQLYKMHNIDVTLPLCKTPSFPRWAREIAELCSTEDGISRWQLARKVLKSSSPRQWAQVRSELSGKGIPDAVITTMEHEIALTNGDEWHLRDCLRRANCREDAQKWIDGSWLEDWTLQCAQSLGYRNSATSIVGRNPQKFEIDIAVLNGYQLFAISCTMQTDWKTQKLKLFEIYTHARQIGGDEARLGMVCANGRPKALERELANEGYRVRVFGFKDFTTLAEKLQDWFQTVE